MFNKLHKIYRLRPFSTTVGRRLTTCRSFERRVQFTRALRVTRRLSNNAFQMNLEELKQKWEKEQEELRKHLIIEDVDGEKVMKLIAGLDISYDKHDSSKAVVTLVLLNNDLNLVYSHSSVLNEIGTSYIPGFLAFREVQPLLSEIELLKQTRPELLPDIVLIDGNGILHQKGFGLASHFGVRSDLRSIGVTKNPYIFENEQLPVPDARSFYKDNINALKNVGDYFPIREPQTEKVVGVGLKSSSEAKNPVYVSIGHKCSLETAISVTLKCCKYRIPEPLRLADTLSRKELSLISSARNS